MRFPTPEPAITGSVDSVSETTKSTSRVTVVLSVSASSPVVMRVSLAAVPFAFLLPLFYGSAFAGLPLLLFILLPGIFLYAIESVLVQQDLSNSTIRLLARVDRSYGALAGAIILVGFGRVFFGLKGYESYDNEPPTAGAQKNDWGLSLSLGFSF